MKIIFVRFKYSNLPKFESYRNKKNCINYKEHILMEKNHVLSC